MEHAVSELKAGRRGALSRAQFAFPAERKLPIHDAAHVRDALARFDQVSGVSDGERDAAWKRLLAAARRDGVQVHEKSWRELGNK